MKKMLLIIDCQKAFINEFTEPYIEKIDGLIKSNKYKNVAFTKYIIEKNMFCNNERNDNL